MRGALFVAFTALLAIFVYRLVSVLSTKRVEKRREADEPCRVAIFLGSGECLLSTPPERRS